MEPGDRGCRREERGSLGFRATADTSAWAPSALPPSRPPLARGPAVPSPRLAAVGASRLPRWGPGARAWRKGRPNEWLGESGAEAPKLAPRWRCREGRGVNPRRGSEGGLGAWERVARAECEISRSGTFPLPCRSLDSSRTPCPGRGLRSPKSALPGPRRSGPGAPRSRLRRRRGVRRREQGRERRFPDLFFSW